MLGWLRRRDGYEGPVEFTVPPEEPGMHSLLVAERESYIAAIDRLAYDAPSWEAADALLDARNAIRPPRVRSVPVVPGRSS